MNLLSCLLPDATQVRLETWTLEPAQSAITINLRARQTGVTPWNGQDSTVGGVNREHPW